MSRIIFFALIFIVSCNANSGRNSSVTLEKDLSDKSTTDKSTTNLNGCYSWTTTRDTAMLDLKVKDDVVSGNLLYDWAEKDRNVGTLQGVIQDTLLVANYTFQSEGTTSVREVVFKIKGDTLIEGFGDVSAVGDTIRYKNKEQLKFPVERPFVKGACIKLP